MKLDNQLLLSCVFAGLLAGCGGGGGGGGGMAGLGAVGTTSAAAPSVGSAPTESQLAAAAAAGTLTPDANWTKLADEDGTFSVASATPVVYGAQDKWVVKTVSGDTACSNPTFGSDPMPGSRKACYTVTSSTVVTGASGNATAGAGDVVDASGNLDGNAYRAMAAVLSKDAGVAYRYGPDAAAYGVGDAGLPTLAKRSDQVTSTPAPHSWQIGSYQNDPGPYSNNQSNAIYVADNPAQRTGVVDFQTTSYDHNTFSQQPQLAWQIAAAPSGGLDGTSTDQYRAQGIVSGDPIAIGRCISTPGFCSTSLVAYQNGVIATSGTNTSNNRTTVKLPANKVPTSIAITNNSEFALVTVWDTAALKGQLAVIALAGLCDGCTPTNRSSWYDWWHEWMGVYPGLPNQGNIAFMKILGYVDLPGVNAPTEVSVSTGLHPWRTLQSDGSFIGYATPLTSQSNRQSFLDGGVNAGRYSRGGVAVVVSKSEKKAVFVDLKPLFTYVNSVYFQGSIDQFNSTMGTLGQGDSQWPHSFSYKPAATPTVIKTVSLAGTPTAVRATPYATAPTSFIATQDGTVHLWSLGGYANGTTASADAIVEKSSLFVGRNPTSIALSKTNPDPDGTDTSNIGQVIVASRGDRKLVWVRAAADGASARVVRTLQDVRMVDPVAVEDADNSATTVNTLSVADYNGRKISNYRFGPVIFFGGGTCPAPAGCAAQGGAEYGGSLNLPGKPFGVKTTNVP